MPTPGQPDTRYGLGAVHSHTGATVGRCRRRQRRRDVAERRQAVVDRQPTGTVSMAWDHAATHCDAAGEAVVRAAAGRLVFLDLPTSSPWLHPRELRWRQFRRAVTHGELFTSLDALLQAARAFFDRDNQGPHRVRSIIGAHAA